MKYNMESLENKVAEMLIRKNLTIATAESCTGGYVAGTLINYPGISSVFKEGFVTYTEEAKMKRLGVKKDTLEKYTVVSSEVAEEMAEGVAKAAGADIGVSTTGIAGPSGGTKTQPVGLVYIAVCFHGKCHSKKLNLTGNRQEVRREAVMEVLELVMNIILNTEK
ncbi:amidohydrolase, PncC family [Hathewaya proteolytica DSM 3090]|uniref:Amidohydrolase, PncC family n=1 Tax=Hathewaya proteolytica DSM 3090 TaxID=1121331 RepID=A0A1M6MSD2_9CLOT|nr:amidohydrolase, PncC family [Hathewaya proteolytica DSM 3090]